MKLLLAQYQEPLQEVAAKTGAVATNGIAVWSWVTQVNDILQLVITGLGVLTGYATYRYMRAKRQLIEEQLNEKKSMEQKK